MKILNLYAGIGGNRKLWGDEHEVTAVENIPEIAEVYKGFFPKDTVIVADAHKYLLDHFQEFDFIWSSPPCPTHSRANTSLKGWGVYRYPDMALYQEIIFLKHFYKGNWVVENVIPYYKPLIYPTAELDRHLFWSNFLIAPFATERKHNVNRATKEALALHHGIVLPEGTKGQRKLLRNAVDPKVGQHVLLSSEGMTQSRLV
jgi:DNA (cytosine-5)-methyltransferase 1